MHAPYMSHVYIDDLANVDKKTLSSVMLATREKHISFLFLLSVMS